MGKPVTPLLAADVIIEMQDRPGQPIVLIKRKNPPYGWALPGGFVDVGESVESAAAREALEETGLKVDGLLLLGIYSDPARDSRGHTASAVYVCQAIGEPIAGDDAGEVCLFVPGQHPAMAFDHDKIIIDYIAWKNERSARS
ncbi:MAG: NUDIX domain-containing protein [Gammaproteobacteria bacterium]